jgi:hypothetical protein
MHQADSQPERTSHRTIHGAEPQELLVRARPEFHALRVLANQVRRRRQSLEIVRFKRFVAIGGRKKTVAVRPSSTSKGVAGLSEVVSRGHVCSR